MAGRISGSRSKGSTDEMDVIFSFFFLFLVSCCVI